MNPETVDTEGFSRLDKFYAVVGVLLVAGVAVAAKENLGAVEGVEPIRVPADAELVSNPNDALKDFEVKTSEAAGISCGKIVIEFGTDFVPPKVIIPIDAKNVLIECNTAGAQRHIPVEHYKPASDQHKPANKGHKAGGKHHKTEGKDHHKPAGKHHKPSTKK